MSFMMAFMAPFMVAISHIDEADGGGTDPEPTDEEKALFGKIKKEMKSYTEGMEKNMLKEEYVDAKVKELQTQLEDLQEATKSHDFEKSITDLKADVQKQIDEVGIEITKMGTKGVQGKTMKDLIKDALGDEGISSYLSKPVGKSNVVDLDVKAIVDVAGFVGAVITPGRVGPDVSFVGPKKFDIRMAMVTGSSDVDNIDHVKETGFVNATGFLAENAASGESTINLEQVTTSSKRIATHIPVSKKSLRNLSYLVSHLTNRFTELIAEKITGSVLNDTGAGNTFNGFFNNATTFTAGSLANKVDDANNADVIGAALARLAEITNLEATAIFMNPLDVYLMTVTKDLQGSYSENSVIVSRIDGNLFINGVRVWSTFHVASDKYLVADLSATTTEFLEVEGLTMMIADQHGTDAVENRVTFIFETEAILPIYKSFAFLKGTLSSDAALLNV